MKRTKILIILLLFSCFTYAQSNQLGVPNVELFKALATEKAEQFGKYLSVIASKATNYQDKETAIQQACKLFIHDTVLIQISYCPSSGENSTNTKKLIKYLRRLAVLNYDKVTLEWTECVMIGGLKKGTDGNYYGVISYRQKFTGKKGEYTYKDETTKHIEIILKPYKKPNDLGENEWKWEVFLSNVKIEEPCL